MPLNKTQGWGTQWSYCELTYHWATVTATQVPLAAGQHAVQHVSLNNFHQDTVVKFQWHKKLL